MSEFEGFQDKPIVDKPIVSEPRRPGMTREQAVAHGMALGRDEADRRGKKGSLRQERIERAAAYAAWDYDGRPVTGYKPYYGKAVT